MGVTLDFLSKHKLEHLARMSPARWAASDRAGFTPLVNSLRAAKRTLAGFDARHCRR